MTPNMNIFSSPDGTEHLRTLFKAAEAEVHLGWDFQRCSKDRGLCEPSLQWHLLDISAQTSSRCHCQLWAANVAVVRRVEEKERLCGDEATTAQTTDSSQQTWTNYSHTDTQAFAIPTSTPMISLLTSPLFSLLHSEPWLC